MKPFFVRSAAVLAALVLGPALLPAQTIPIRTVPVASGDQFLLLPGTTLGLGGVETAVADSLADPWYRPGAGVFVRESAFSVSPTVYGISGDGGGGRTFPVSGVFRSGDWFGGVAVAMQQIDNGGGDVFVDPWWGWRPQGRLRDRSNRNLFARGFVGTRLGRGPWSVGVAAGAAGLSAMDGVDLLYAGSQDIRQDGSLVDVRVGLHREGRRDALDITLLHARTDVTHDVTWVDWTVPTNTDVPVVTERIEVNEDRSRTWGGRVGWMRDLDADGWRVGAAATVNRKTHPKIPNYQIQNIPRDPGESWAWELATGLSHRTRGTLFAVDVAVQPIWSDTWQEADTALVGAGGRTLASGDRTIENDFTFLNVVMRAGFQADAGPVELQGGVEARSYDYDLRQDDRVEGTTRFEDEAWLEWTPTLGAAYRFSSAELRYVGRLTTGTGRPGIDRGLWFAEGDALAAGDFIIAPQGPLTLQDATVLTHQLSVRIPIR